MTISSLSKLEFSELHEAVMLEHFRRQNSFEKIFTAKKEFTQWFIQNFQCKLSYEVDSKVLKALETNIYEKKDFNEITSQYKTQILKVLQRDKSFLIFDDKLIIQKGETILKDYIALNYFEITGDNILHTKMVYAGLIPNDQNQLNLNFSKITVDFVNNVSTHSPETLSA